MASEAARLFVLVDARISGLEAGLARAEARSEQAARSMERSSNRASLSFANMGKNAAQSIGQAAHKAALVSAIFAGFAVSKGISQLVNFDRAMQNVNSIAQLSDRSLATVKQRVLELAGQTAQAPVTLAQGLYDLVSSGFNAKQSLLILRSSAKAATAGLTDTATSTKAVAAVLNAYHRPASDAANVSDALFQTVNRGVISFEQLSTVIGDVLPFASSLGIGLNQVGASISTMTKEGLSGAEATTRIKNTMIAFIKPSQGMAAAVKATGYESGEALVRAKGFQGALESVIGTTDGTKQQIAGLFPNIRALGGALALTGGNAKSAQADLNGFKDVTGATDKALKEQAKSASYTWNKIKAEVSAAAISIGQKSLPTIEKAMRDVEHVFQRKDLTFNQKINLGIQVAEKDLAPLGHQLEHAFSAAIPGIASAAGHMGVSAAKAFVSGFADSSTGGKLLIEAWLLHKMGALNVFKGVGRAGGAQMAAGIGEGVVAGGLGSGLAKGGKLRALGANLRTVGRTVIGLQLAMGIAEGLQTNGSLASKASSALKTMTLGAIPDIVGDQKRKNTIAAVQNASKEMAALQKAAFSTLTTGNTRSMQTLAQLNFDNPSASIRKYADGMGRLAGEVETLGPLFNKLPKDVKIKFAALSDDARFRITQLAASADSLGHHRQVVKILADGDMTVKQKIAALQALQIPAKHVRIMFDRDAFPPLNPMPGGITIPLHYGSPGAVPKLSPIPRGVPTPSLPHGKLKIGGARAKANPFLDLAQSDIESMQSDAQSKADDLARQLAATETVGSGKHAHKRNTLRGKARTKAQKRLRDEQGTLGQLGAARDRALRTALGFGTSDVSLADAESSPDNADNISALRTRIAKDSSRIAAIRRKLGQKGVSRGHRLSLQSELSSLVGDRTGRQSTLNDLTKAPSPADFANMNVALASLTKTLDDDRTAAQALVSARQKELDDANATGDPSKIADAASNLKSALDSQASIGADAPTAVDFAQAKVAMAGLTTSLDDDKLALQNDLIPALQTVLADAQASGDPRQVAQAANDLKGAMDSLAQLAAQADANVQAQNALLQEQNDNLARLYAIAQSEEGTLGRALANTVSAHLGARVGRSGQTPTRSVVY